MRLDFFFQLTSFLKACLSLLRNKKAIMQRYVIVTIRHNLKSNKKIKKQNGVFEHPAPDFIELK